MQSQIDDLVRDRLQLLDRLQENATDESDKKGIRLVGLSVGHLDMVRSYVNTLSEGSIPEAISTQQSFVHLSERLPDARRIEGGLQQTALQKEHFARILQLENEKMPHKKNKWLHRGEPILTLTSVMSWII